MPTITSARPACSAGKVTALSRRVHDSAAIEVDRRGLELGLSRMLASIITGLAAMMAASASSALLLFAHLTGRVRRAMMLAITLAALAVGAALALAGSMDGFVLGHVAIPIGVSVMLAAALNGLLAYQASKR